LVVTGGIGGPTARLIVWRHGGGGWWDYGRGFSECMETLWSGVGVIDPDVLGTFDITIPAAAMAWWPPRCGWSFQLDWDGGIGSEMIAQGSLHVRRVAGKLFPPVPLLTDGLVPILTD